MKVALWCLGKNPIAYLETGIDFYQKKINHYLPFELQIIPIPKAKKNEAPAAIKQIEADLILKKLKPEDRLILLDEGGKKYNSRGFSDFLQQQFHLGSGRLIFLIGGAFGFDQSIYNRAVGKVSFSDMTFNHLMFRLIFLEQLYRAMSIQKGEPYHH